jgi:hypothetical protein
MTAHGLIAAVRHDRIPSSHAQVVIQARQMDLHMSDRYCSAKLDANASNLAFRDPMACRAWRTIGTIHVVRNALR